MRKTTLLMQALLLLLGAMRASAQIYRPKEQVSELTPGTPYLIANTANTDRRFFIFYNSENTGKPGHTSIVDSPRESILTGKKYIWTLEKNTTDGAIPDDYYLRTSAGTYVGIHGATGNTSPAPLTIKNWANSDHKAAVQSTSFDGTMKTQTGESFGADYDQMVWTIQNEEAYNSGSNKGAWNGNNQNQGWAEWGKAHPYAFYTVEALVEEEDMDLYEQALTTASHMPYRLKDIYGLVSSAEKYTSNATHPTEGSIESLLDGDYDTFFHSRYNHNVGEYHYLQAELSEPVNSFYFYFKKRSSNNNNRPTEIEIQGSSDGENFETITTINSGLPTDNAETDYISDEIDAAEGRSYSYLRFVVKATNNNAKDATDGHPFFTFSEFYILPVNDEVTTVFGAVKDLRNFAGEDFAKTVQKISDLDKELSDLSCTVTIQHKFDGILLHETTQEVQKNVPHDFENDYHYFGLTCTNEFKGVRVTADRTIVYEYAIDSTQIPFKISSVAADGAFVDGGAWWYLLTLRGKNSFYDEATNRVKNESTMADGSKDKYLFAFTGDPVRGFKIYNYAVGTAKVLGGEANATASLISMMEDPNDAERFILENNGEGENNIYVFRKKDTALGYLNDIQGQTVNNVNGEGTTHGDFWGYWLDASARTDAGSTFTFEEMGSDLNEIELNAAKVLLAQTIDGANLYTGTGADLLIGGNFNQYRSDAVRTREDLLAFIAEAEAARDAEDATAETVTAAADKLNGIISGLALNMPATGTLLRVRATSSSQPSMPFLSSENSEKSDKTTHSAFIGTKDEKTIFYYTDDRKLAAYSGGMYLKNNNGFAGYATNAAGNEGTVVGFRAADNGALGAYNISFNDGHRWLFTGYASAGGSDYYYYSDAGNSCDHRHGYNFWLEEVEMLPVKIVNEKKFATFWSPVPLTVPTGLEVYTVAVDEEQNAVVLTLQSEGAVLPAATGVLLHGEVGTYDFTVTESDGAAIGSLIGQTHLGTFSYEEGVSKVYTLQTKKDGNMGFRKYTGSTIPAFKAYLDLAGMNVSADQLGLIFADDEATGISGVAAAVGDSAAGIYDLGGRRMAAPKKGLYIVNGTKVLIK